MNKVYVLFGLFVLTTLSSCNNGATKVGYFDMKQVYESFQMRKDLLTEFRAFEQMIDSKLDTLNLHLIILNRDLASNKMPSEMAIGLAEAIKTKEDKIQELSDLKLSRLDEFDRNIEKQLVAYIDEFMKTSDFDIVVTNVEDKLIYCPNEKCDITNRVTEFVNDRYNDN